MDENWLLYVLFGVNFVFMIGMNRSLNKRLVSIEEDMYEAKFVVKDFFKKQALKKKADVEVITKPKRGRPFKNKNAPVSQGERGE